MGPWTACRRAGRAVDRAGRLGEVQRVRVILYGSLAKTGVGHGTHRAVMMGLAGADPRSAEPEEMASTVKRIRTERRLQLCGRHAIEFDPDVDIVANVEANRLDHPNTMDVIFEYAGRSLSRAPSVPGSATRMRYFSVGGGFVVEEGAEQATPYTDPPFPISSGSNLIQSCRREGLDVHEIVGRNEAAWRPANEIEDRLTDLWAAMKSCVYRGCRRTGTLPGGLDVERRAPRLARQLLSGAPLTDGPVRNGTFAGLETHRGSASEDAIDNVERFLQRVRSRAWSFPDVNKWVTCFALAVNEVNAAFGRIVTAPTNGAAGVLPAVMLYDYCFGNGSASGGGTPGNDGSQGSGGCPASRETPGGRRGADRSGSRGSSGDIVDADPAHAFLLTAGQIGILFKQGATLSAAMGGCQAEIGVSSAMAAAGLTERRGGTPEQVLMAAEIAMEHHLGMTCDPVGGLVQIPCIERNAMGAAKAITASHLALESNPDRAKVSLDSVIRTMWETARDMDDRYKETSEGGLAAQIPVSVIEC